MRTRSGLIVLAPMVAAVIAVGVLNPGGHRQATSAATSTSAPATATAATAGPAVVVGIDWDPQQPITTFYARCRTAGGQEFLVVSPAAVDQLSQGQPCPAGRHLPTSDLATYDELTGSLPYHGGDPHSVCGEWEAASATWAKEMAAEQAKCEAQHAGGGHR